MIIVMEYFTVCRYVWDQYSFRNKWLLEYLLSKSNPVSSFNMNKQVNYCLTVGTHGNRQEREIITHILKNMSFLNQYKCKLQMACNGNFQNALDKSVFQVFDN